VTKRVLAAFLVAPLVGALLYGTAGLAGSTFVGGLYDFLVMILVVYLFAASATVLVALPAYLLLKRRSLIRWWSALVVGSGVGLLFALAIGLFTSSLLSGNYPMILIGALSGLAFWLIVRPVPPPNQRLERP